jgi:hypothetical protein
MHEHACGLEKSMGSRSKHIRTHTHTHTYTHTSAHTHPYTHTTDTYACAHIKNNLCIRIEVKASGVLFAIARHTAVAGVAHPRGVYKYVICIGGADEVVGAGVGKCVHQRES